MNLDRDIFKAIKGHTETSPHDLVGILAYIDSQQKLLMTHEELSGGLQRLIDSGQIAEATPHVLRHGRSIALTRVLWPPA